MNQTIANSSDTEAMIQAPIDTALENNPDSTPPPAEGNAEEAPKVDPLASIIPTQVIPIETQEQLLAIHESHRLWKESILNPKSHGSVGRACFKGLDLKHLNFCQLDFSYADFSDCHAEGVDFSAANLSRAIFNKAHLDGANFSASLLKKTSFMRAALGTADFTSAKADTADFSWATGDYPDQLRHKNPDAEETTTDGQAASKESEIESKDLEEEELNLEVDTESLSADDVDGVQDPSQLN